MLTKIEYKNYLERILNEIPKDLVCIIFEYQDSIYGQMIYKWIDSHFNHPRFLRIQNQTLFLLDERQFWPQDRILRFHIAKNSIHMIYEAQVTRDYFVNIGDFDVNKGKTELLLLDIYDPIFKSFSLPDFVDLNCISKPKQPNYDDDNDDDDDAYGITSDGTYYYVTFPHRIDQFDHNLQMKQSFEAKCLIRPNRIIYEDNFLWTSDERSKVVHVMSLDGKCNYHCGEGRLQFPENLALYGQEVFVVDQSCIFVLDRKDGHFIRFFGEKILKHPFDIFIYQGQAWITDMDLHCVFIFE